MWGCPYFARPVGTFQGHVTCLSAFTSPAPRRSRYAFIQLGNWDTSQGTHLYSWATGAPPVRFEPPIFSMDTLTTLLHTCPVHDMTPVVILPGSLLTCSPVLCKCFFSRIFWMLNLMCKLAWSLTSSYKTGHLNS